MARNELGNIEREVASLKHRVDALRANRQEAVDELEQARAARRRILVDGGGDANAADRRVLDQATKIEGVDDAVAVVVSQLALSEGRLADLKATAAREAQARAIETHIPKIEQAFAAVATAVEALEVALRAVKYPEVTALAHWCAEFIGPAKLEVPHVTGLLRDHARILRTGATPQPVTGPPPQPLLVLQPERAFIDRTRDVPEWPVRP